MTLIVVPSESNPVFAEWAWQRWRQETEGWCPNRADAVAGMERVIKSLYAYPCVVGHMIGMWDVMVYGIGEDDEG